MRQVTDSAVRAKLKKIIKEQFGELEWIGIQQAVVDCIDDIQPILSNDFRYEGSGEYEFSAYLSFMVKETSNEFGTHREKYMIYPCCKMSIKEIENDFNIDILSPIPLQKI